MIIIVLNKSVKKYFKSKIFFKKKEICEEVMWIIPQLLWLHMLDYDYRSHPIP